MTSLSLNHLNALPAKTWHHLRVNDSFVEIPPYLTYVSSLDADYDASLCGSCTDFDEALSLLQKKVDQRRIRSTPDERICLKALNADATDSDLDVPALSQYQRITLEQEVENSVEKSFMTGMGNEARKLLLKTSRKTNSHHYIRTKEGKTSQGFIRIKAHDGSFSAASIDIVVSSRSTLKLIIDYESPSSGVGFIGLTTRIFVGENAHLDLTTTQTLDTTWISLDDTGMVLDDGAQANIRHTILGADRSYTGLSCDLRGNASALTIDTRYVGAKNQHRDFNYIVKHHGCKSFCNLDAKGVLLGSSSKILRGTIDLVHGCSGSEGTEHESVLLVDDNVINKTIPIILCDEDNVSGNHGATIGHVRPEQLFYLSSRGLSYKDCESLFARAAFEEAYITAPNRTTKNNIVKVAGNIGVSLEEID